MRIPRAGYTSDWEACAVCGKCHGLKVWKVLRAELRSVVVIEMLSGCEAVGRVALILYF